MQVEVARRKPRETARWLVICLDRNPPETRNSRNTALRDQSESILTQGSATRHICVKKLNSHQSLTPPGFACVTTKADRLFLISSKSPRSATQELAHQKLSFYQLLRLAIADRVTRTRQLDSIFNNFPRISTQKLSSEKLSFYQLFNRRNPALAASNAAPKRLRATSTGHRFYSVTLPHGAAVKNSLFINVSVFTGRPAPIAKAWRFDSICNFHFTICYLLSLLSRRNSTGTKPARPVPEHRSRVNASPHSLPNLMCVEARSDV